MNERQALGVNDTARILGVHRETVLKLIHTKEIPATKLGGTWFIPRPFVERIVSAPAS